MKEIIKVLFISYNFIMEIDCSAMFKKKLRKKRLLRLFLKIIEEKSYFLEVNKN